MYRIENYITSIILSKVDRYIKNFRREDVKVSLWKGDCILYNLDLDLDVLEQELNLPFSFTSGHIHQLQIHVPWTRLNSEPVQVTINTIECVMKLTSTRHRTPPPTPPAVKQVNTEENLAPSSYLTSLVNKILCNLSVTCNNLILKYVEEDIVLSMNVKTLSLATVNSSWICEFSELTAADLILRKLISLVDVTVCLDKRNASGRIESYLKPLLYKCSMVLRLSRSYPSVNSSNSSSTRMALHCDNVNLSISEPQVSMLLRLYFLTRTAVSQSKESSSTSILSHHSTNPDLIGEDSCDVGWGSWLWGFVPTISPRLLDPADSVEISASLVNKVHLGLYLDQCTLDLKLCKAEEANDWESILQVVLGGCFVELTSNGSDWSNVQVGICSANVSPVPNSKQETYVECGEVPKTFFSSSLFANPDVDLTQRPWEYHLSTITETLMMERAPTFYMDYISIVEKDHCYDIRETFREVRERQLVRYVVGPVCISIGSQLVEKLAVVKQSLYSYDYSPYTQHTNAHEYSLSEDDVELFKATVDTEGGYFVPQHTSQFTFFGARIRIFPSDSSYLQHSTGVTSKGGPPYILLKIKCLDGKLIRPMFPDKLASLSSLFQLPENTLAAAQTTLNLLLVEGGVSVAIRDAEGPDVFQVSNLSWCGAISHLFGSHSSDNIIKQSSLLIERVMLFSTKPKLILGWEILFSLVTSSRKSDLLYNTSLLRDCRNTNESVYLELKVHDCEGKYLLKNLSECASLSIGSVIGSTVLTRDAARDPVLTTSSPHNENFLEMVVQRPLGSEWSVAPLLSFRICGLNICLGRNICLYVMYSPQTNHIRAFNIMQTSGSARKISTSSLSSLQKKQSLEQMKQQSSSADILPQFLISYISTVSEEGLKLMSLVVSGDVTAFTLVFPSPSCSDVGSSLVFTLASLSIRSPLGRISYDLVQMPIQVDNWNQSRVNFPWSIFLCEGEGYTERSGLGRLTLLKKVSSTLTLALTTKHNAELNRVSSVAVCLHIDTTAISVALSHQQVVLLSEVIASLYQVYHALVPVAVPTDPPAVQPLPCTPPPHEVLDRTKTSDDSASNSLSNRTPVGSAEEAAAAAVDTVSGDVKVTVWLQCTITKCTLSLYSLPSKYSDQHLKFVLDIDDIFMTLDIVSVYQKMKIKVATAQAKHHARSLGNTAWTVGCFSGVIMKANETNSDTKESDDFLSITLTRASAANLHKRLHHTSKKTTKELERGYVSEVVVKVRPLDFVLSPLCIGKILQILDPLLDQQDLFPLGRHYSSSPIYGQSVFTFTTSNLPLLHLDIALIRLFVPVTSSSSSYNANYDTVYMQVEKVSLSSEAVNPVSRKFVRSELYERHGNRLTSVPGSTLEDRQYQLDSSITVSTGKWCQVVRVMEEEEGAVGQNPAVYWNSAQDHQSLHHTTSPLLSHLALTVIIAPPIMTSGFIISGLNVEVNIVSEVDLSVDLEQMKLVTGLFGEVMRSFPLCSLTAVGGADKVQDQLDRVTAPSDSGVDSVQDSFTTTKTDLIEIPVCQVAVKSSSISQISLSTPTSINTRRYHQRTQTVPIDILITTKAIVAKLYRKSTAQLCEPLVFILVSQPYIALEKQADISILKGSLYELDVRHGSPGQTVECGKVNQQSYSVSLVQNRSGDADPDKGIPPALFNFKSTSHGIRSPTIDIELGRPIKCLIKSSSIDYMSKMRDILLEAFSLPQPLNIPKELSLKTSSSCILNKRNFEEKSSASQLKTYFHSCSVFNINTKQIVIDFQIPQPAVRGCLVSVGCITVSGEWSDSSYLSSRGQVSAVCLSGYHPHPYLILGPWTVAASFTRDAKLPSVTATVDAGLLPVDVSREAVANLTSVYDEFIPYFIRPTSAAKQMQFNTDLDVDEHHYKDDLQAGAFQFVSSGGSCSSRNLLPLPYQVVFPSDKIMAWTYPAPRAVTAVSVLPLPSSDAESECDGVRICLEYYECGVWREWIEIAGSWFDTVEAAIPSGLHVSSTWRARIKSSPSPHISVSALATALRISSVYSPTIVPYLTLRLDVHSLQVSVWTRQSNMVNLPGSLSRYSADSSLPSSYPVCTLFLEPVQSFFSYWKSGDMACQVDMRPRLDVLNPRTLLQQCCLQPFCLSAKATLDSAAHSSAQWHLYLKSSAMVIRLAPPLCHTLLAASKGVVLTPYVVCNDSTFPIRFGQMGTVEDIVLESLRCNFYSWRSAKQQTLLRFSLSQRSRTRNPPSPPLSITPQGIWSEGICLDTEKMFRLELEDESNRTVMLLVEVKHLSPILTQVIVGGQLLIYNMLDAASLDCRVVSSSISERQRQVTLTPSCRAPALSLSPSSKYSLRLSTVPNRWSGLIPLMTNNNVWIVKIPLEDRDQYISAWCQIVQEQGCMAYPRLLVILSPIYLLRSYLPCESNVIIRTEGFPGQVSQAVPGRGSTCNLKAMGTATHKHTLDFNIEGLETEGGGGISLSYGLVEGRGPAPGPVPPLPELVELADVQSHLSTEWPPLSTLYRGTASTSSYNWVRVDQPNTLTNVKVKFGCDLLKVTNSLMVELQPWALLINTTGFHVYLMKDSATLASLPHFSVVAPPHLQGCFKLGVDLESSGVHLSSDIELSQSQMFYIPQISGIVPLSGQLNLNIPANDKMVCVTVQSNLSNGIRIIHAAPSFSIINLSSYDLSVAPLLISREHNKLIIPRDIDSYSLPLPMHSVDKPVGIGLSKWFKIGDNCRQEGRHYLLFDYKSLVSTPVNISVTKERQVHTVLLPLPVPSSRRASHHSSASYNADCNEMTGRLCNLALTVVVQTVNGQTFITVDDQVTPQLVIHNDTGVNLVVTKATPTRGGAGLAVDDFPDWDWRLPVPNCRTALYFIRGQQDQGKPVALMLSRPETNCWSNIISVVGSSSGRLVTVPQCLDVTASVFKRGPTLHVRLLAANQRIVAASDIRSRLSNIYLPATSPESAVPFLCPNETVTTEDGCSPETIEQTVLPIELTNDQLDTSCSATGTPAEPSFNFSAQLNNITLVLCSEAPNSYRWVDIASLSLDNVSVSSYSSPQKDDGVVERCMDVEISEIQLDNEEYQRGGYDFSVVLICKSDPEKHEPALRLQLVFDKHSVPALQDIVVTVCPMQAYVEDVYITRIKDQISKMLPEMSVVGADESEQLRLPEERTKEKEEIGADTSSADGIASGQVEETANDNDDDELFNVSDSEMEQDNHVAERETAPKQSSVDMMRTCARTQLPADQTLDGLPFPDDVLLTALELSRPLHLRTFSISPVSVKVTVHTSTKFYIALDNSPLQFGAFDRKEIITTTYRLGHALSMHYFLGAIYGTGWAIGSVELLGAPAGLARSVGTGLKSFVTLPCRGAVNQGPAGFLSGFVHGSASLMKHLTAGAVMSVTKLAGSWSRTLDRLTLEDEDLKYAEEMRRVRPEGITQALKLGLTELGVNILGGVGGLAQKPLEYVASGNQSLASSLGLALVGVITRPVSGAAELLALTGQGILAGAGWTDNHLPKHESGGRTSQLGSESRLRYSWKYLPADETLLAAIESACCIAPRFQEKSCVSLLTTRRLCLVDAADNLAQSYDLATLDSTDDPNDPLRINFYFVKDASDNVETLSKRRIEEFIRESGRSLRKSPPGFCSTVQEGTSPHTDSTLFHLYLPTPAQRVHFVSLLTLAKRQRSDLGFAIISS